MDSPLPRALTEPTVPAMRRLPEDVEELLHQLDAPARLCAHLRAVHDVAARLVEALAAAHPGLDFDPELVLFGAATHDVGKVIHPEELAEPGSRHERAGYELLVACGIAEPRARFARDHGGWTDPGLSTESLLVTLADKVWKGKRVIELEERVGDRIGGRAWETFMTLDDILAGIADHADARLAFQNRY